MTVPKLAALTLSALLAVPVAGLAQAPATPPSANPKPASGAAGAPDVKPAAPAASLTKAPPAQAPMAKAPATNGPAARASVMKAPAMKAPAARMPMKGLKPTMKPGMMRKPMPRTMVRKRHR